MGNNLQNSSNLHSKKLKNHFSNKQKAETYSKACQRSKKKFFVKTVNEYKSLTLFAKNDILNVLQSSEYACKKDLRKDFE